MSINTKIGRKYDYFKDLIVPRGCYFMVRLDGNCFSSFTKRFERPFDKRFYMAMVAGTEKLMTYIPDIYKAHFHSDEISLYFNKGSEWFNRRVQKITSITSGILSAKFSAKVGDEAHYIKEAKKLKQLWIDKDIRWCEFDKPHACDFNIFPQNAHRHKKGWYLGKPDWLRWNFNQAARLCQTSHHFDSRVLVTPNIEFNAKRTAAFFMRLRGPESGY